MRYPVLLQQTEEGYTVSCRILPGCISEGDTESEAMGNIRIAIEEYLSVVQEISAEIGR